MPEKCLDLKAYTQFFVGRECTETQVYLWLLLCQASLHWSTLSVLCILQLQFPKRLISTWPSVYTVQFWSLFFSAFSGLISVQFWGTDPTKGFRSGNFSSVWENSLSSGLNFPSVSGRNYGLHLNSSQCLTLSSHPVTIC